MITKREYANKKMGITIKRRVRNKKWWRDDQDNKETNGWMKKAKGTKEVKEGREMKG